MVLEAIQFDLPTRPKTRHNKSALGVEHRKEGIEAFGQQRVREYRVRHGGVSESAQHGHLDHGHDLAAFGAPRGPARARP